MSRWYRDEEVLTARAVDVCEILKLPSARDADGHGSVWWAKRLSEVDFFTDLTPTDFMVILGAVLRDTSPWALPLQEHIREAIKIELGEQ
jgi:hypothetical protein